MKKIELSLNEEFYRKLKLLSKIKNKPIEFLLEKCIDVLIDAYPEPPNKLIIDNDEYHKMMTVGDTATYFSQNSDSKFIFVNMKGNLIFSYSKRFANSIIIADYDYEKMIGTYRKCVDWRIYEENEDNNN